MKSSRLDGAEVGDPVFVDSDGFVRFAGRTCNTYGHPDDAEAAVRLSELFEGRIAYIWRTVDGLFDFSATEDANAKLPELAGAEIVRVVVVSPGGTDPKETTDG